MAVPLWLTMADPIHGVIRLKRQKPSHKLVLDVMNSQAFQRLRRIKQMGMAEFVFPGATHSRFEHSIGATWLMVKTLDHLQDDPEIAELLNSPFEDTGVPLEELLLISILVHDIGHMPLSHTLEDILDMKDRALLHDTYWNRFLLENDPELQRLWKKYNPELPRAMFAFNGWEPDHEAHFLSDLVSSQLDLDRLDYLQRDSHYLGVQYGRIEVDRIITNLCIGMTAAGKPAVAVKEEAVTAVEHYLFGRYEAYKMALHSLDKASETLLKKTLERFRWARENDLDTGHPAELLYQLIVDGRTLSIDDYLMLDDCYLWDKVNMWARYSQDPLLKALSLRLLNHNLFKFIELNPYLMADGGDPSQSLEPLIEAIEKHYQKRGLSFEFGFEQMIVAPKPLYQSSPVKPPIWIRDHDNTLLDFAEVSSLPLHSESRRGVRCLLFLWDSEMRYFVKGLLDKGFLSKAKIIESNTLD